MISEAISETDILPAKFIVMQFNLIRRKNHLRRLNIFNVEFPS